VPERDEWMVDAFMRSADTHHRPTVLRPAGRKRLAEEAILPLVGAVAHTVVTMVDGGRITDGGKYPG
jgi:hypothetical protein